MIPKSRVYVVDDEPGVRRAICRLLQTDGHTTVPFGSAQEFLNTKADAVPSCLILDLRMPGINGLELQQTLAAAGRLMPIIFISGRGDIPSSVRAMKAGAVDFLTKPFEGQDLLKAVRRALEQDELVRKEQSQRRVIGHRRQQLTEREDQVLSMVVGGRLNKQIASKLGISEKTVKVHRARVMDKMRADSLAELVALTLKSPFPMPTAGSVRTTKVQ